jgi:hypothetical protein
MAHSLGGGGGDNSRRQSGAKQSVGTTLQQTALQHMTQRMLHQIDRLAGQAQHLWFDPNTDQIHISTELRATCEQALLNTLCNWDQLPTLTPEQLRHRQADLAYSQHIDKMRPDWAQNAADGHIGIYNATADGACMFNSVSILLTGHEGYNETLRLHSLVELILNANRYIQRDQYLLADSRTLSGAHTLAERLNQIEGYTTTLQDLPQPKGWTRIGTAAAIAQVIGREVRVYCPTCMQAPSHITYLQTSITPQRALGHGPVVLSWEVYKWPGYSYDAGRRRHDGVIINNNHYVPVAIKHDLEVSALGHVDHQHSLQHERQAPAQEHHAPQIVTAATAPTNV